MCTKHTGCSSQKINVIRPVAEACDAPKVAKITTVSSQATSEGCSSGSECCSAEPEEPSASSGQEQEASTANSDGLLKSWKVVGMDCPACARKVETATNRISGVVSSKVMFATEKLVVRVDEPTLFSQVEAAVVDAGLYNPYP